MDADPSTTQLKPSEWLRPSEKLLVVLPCRVRQPGTPFVKSDVLLVSSAGKGNEQAGLLIIHHDDRLSQPRILHALPINTNFSHSLLQTPPSPSTSFFQQSARPHITLDVKQGDERFELRIAAHHTLLVQSLTKELRRISEIVGRCTTPITLQHHWLSLYPIDSGPVEEAPSTSTSLSEAGSRDASALGLPSASSSLASPMTSLSIGSDVNRPDVVADGEDERHPNPYAPSFSRLGFLRKRLLERQSHWSASETIKIRCATYNVNDRLPPKGTTELASLVGDGSDDLMVFGFQEVDVRHQALLFAQGNDRAQAWEEALFRGLGDRANEFEKLAFSQYVGVMTIILVRKTLRPAITRVETSERGIGLLGFAGNKAGVAVRMKVHDTTLAFVNCHLAAFSAALDRRRLDYSTLRKSLTFPRPLESEVSNLAYEEFLSDKPDELLSLDDTNALFWLGDLNYRIDLDDDKLAALVKWKRWADVLEKDQLRSDARDGKSFADFKEAAIDFPPSFKYVHGSTTLDTRRPAAYTDRVLYKVAESSTETMADAGIVKTGVYTSHEILWSDHRPVSCTFDVSVRIPDEEKRKAELAIARSELDKLDEEWAPAIEVDNKELEFGDVRHGIPAIETITLSNKGRVPAHFNFKAPTGRSICKPIYWPFPAIGVIEPGESIELRITISVDTVWSPRLTTGEEDTNDVLVLQVADGKDTFITLHGDYLSSIIGLPLTQLNKLPNGIRELSMAQRKCLTDAIPLLTPKEEGSDPYEARRPSKAVKPAQVIWRLLESLMEKHDGVMWTGPVDKKAVLSILEALDTDQPLPECPAAAISHTLVYILAALPEPLVPVYLQSECLEAGDRDTGYAILEGVEGVHTNILIGLMSVVRLCSPDSASDDSTVVSLVPAVFGPQAEGEEADSEREGRIRFVKILLEG